MTATDAMRLTRRLRHALRAGCAALVALLGGLVCAAWPLAARADVWAFVDERGVPHFASEKLDDRYELFFKPAPAEASRHRAAANEPAYARAVAVPRAQAKLLAYFEFSPAYKRIQHLLRDAARANGLDVELLQAVVATESGFDPSAVSPKGAVGLMQLMPTTAARWGVREDARATVEQKLLDPRINLHAGARYLRHLLGKYPGRLDLSLAAYNAGEGAVARAGDQRIPAIRETQDYVKTILQMVELLKPPLAPSSIEKFAIKNEVKGWPSTPASASVSAQAIARGGARGRGNMVPSLADAPPPGDVAP